MAVRAFSSLDGIHIQQIREDVKRLCRLIAEQLSGTTALMKRLAWTGSGEARSTSRMSLPMPFCFCAINADPVLCRLPDGFFCAVLGSCCSHDGGRLVACAAEKANPGAGKLRTEEPFAQILPRFYKREHVHFTRPLYTVLVTQEQEEEE